MLIKVQNATGGNYNPDVPTGYKSWLDYWEKHTGVEAERCRYCNQNFPHNELVGGHVVADGYAGIYIVPLSIGANNSENTAVFEVEESDLVRVR